MRRHERESGGYVDTRHDVTGLAITTTTEPVRNRLRPSAQSKLPVKIASFDVRRRKSSDFAQ